MKRIVMLCLTLAALIALLAVPVSASGETADLEIYGTQNYDEINTVLRLVNKERAEEGLEPLVLDPTLVEYAMQRAAECAVYYDHVRPNGTSCFTVMDSYYLTYAGENIAAGYRTGSAVMGDDDDPDSGGWMNSQGHKENILSSNYQSIGIGCFYQDNGTKYWVQLFSGSAATATSTKTGTATVQNVPIEIHTDILQFCINNNDAANEVSLYEGTTVPLSVQLVNAGWEYASCVNLSSGYTLRSNDTAYLTVNNKKATLTGVKNGTSGFKVVLDDGTAVQVRATIWDTPTLSYTIESDGTIVVLWEDEGGQAYLFGKEQSDTSWNLYSYPFYGEGYCQIPSTGADDIYTFVLRTPLHNGELLNVSKSLVAWPHPMPVISKLQNTAKGVNITWKAVDGAAKYRVYVKNASGGWSKIGETTGTSFTYTKAVSGEDYTFTVRCITSDSQGFTSYYDTTGKSIVYIAQPAVTKLANAENGVKVTWGAVDGAAKYRLYVKTPGGAWTRVGETAGTSMTYTGAVSGQTYYFTVRCINADGSASTSSYDNTGKGITYIAQPSVTKVANTAGGVKVTWGAVDGAAKYRLYVKTPGGAWTRVGETTGTSMTYSGAVSGQTYYFTVRCTNAEGTVSTSSYDNTGKSIVYIAQPAVTKLTNAANGVKVTWGAVGGAAKYRLYVKTPGGAWTRVGETTGTSMTYTGAVSGQTYYFTVRCINAEGTASTSSYDNTGKGIVYIGQPAVTALENTESGVKVTWDAVDGAAQYRLYFKVPGGAWTRVGETTDTTLTYTGAVSGETYYFTVRCINAEGTASTSSYDNTGKSITYLP